MLREAQFSLRLAQGEDGAQAGHNLYQFQSKTFPALPNVRSLFGGSVLDSKQGSPMVLPLESEWPPHSLVLTCLLLHRMPAHRT